MNWCVVVQLEKCMAERRVRHSGFAHETTTMNIEEAATPQSAFVVLLSAPHLLLLQPSTPPASSLITPPSFLRLQAEKFDSSEHPVVAIKGARLSDFGGRSLSALFSSTVMVNPDLPEAFRLRAW